MISIKKLNKEELLKISGGYVRRVNLGGQLWYAVFKRGVIVKLYSAPGKAFDRDDAENGAFELPIAPFERKMEEIEEIEEIEGVQPKKRRRDETSLVY